MTLMNCQLTIDKEPFSFQIEGDFFWGIDQVLFNPSSSVIMNTSWKKDGYALFDLLTVEEFNRIQENISSLLKSIALEIGIDLPDHFSPEKYHLYFNTQELHNQVIQKTRFLTFKDFKIDFQQLCTRVSDFIKYPLQLENPLLDEEIVILRISRPKSLDINPLHRDGYLDIWANVLNLWIPLAGCDENSSLPVFPESHLLNETKVYRSETKGARINGLGYHVPGIVDVKGGLDLIRPNPAYRQALLFTPFLIHGAAINQNENKTRLSLELRFCKKGI